MKQSNQNSTEAVLTVSQKVQKLENISSIKSELKLPSKDYGPFCMKVLTDFIEHHNLPKDLPLPCPGLTTTEALSRIFNVILYSMGDEKRLDALEKLKEYNMGIPSCFRN